jgi:hypothetical protein
LKTEHQRGAQFYLAWFARLYQCGDAGWFAARTPDDKPICEQDAYFWFALETIARELNAMRAAEMASLSNR